MTLPVNSGVRLQSLRESSMTLITDAIDDSEATTHKERIEVIRRIIFCRVYCGFQHVDRVSDQFPDKKIYFLGNMMRYLTRPVA